MIGDGNWVQGECAAGYSIVFASASAEVVESWPVLALVGDRQPRRQRPNRHLLRALSSNHARADEPNRSDAA